MLRYVFFFLCLFMASFAMLTHSDTIYKTVDEQGNVVFSDVPSDDSKAIDVELQNIQEATQITAPPAQQAPSAAKTEYRITLLSPAEGQRFGPTQRYLSISVEVQPGLSPQHNIAFYLDGKQVAAPSRATSTRIPMGLKMRGRHSVQAKLITQQGKTVDATQSVSIYTIRPN